MRIHGILALLACLAPVGCDKPSAQTTTPEPAIASTETPAPSPEPAVTESPDKPDPKPTETAADAATPDANDVDAVVERSEEEWKLLLTPQEYYVLREKGTERPWTNKYDKHFEPGAYACAACGLILFESDTKFDSGCGWPAFYAAKAGDRVKLHKDVSFNMVRTEVVCARCNGHLGHVFDDAPQTPTGNRFCINSVSIKFIPKNEGESGAPPKPTESDE